MAADSAVTIGGPYGPKVYNTVNKLFALSKFHPVGIMVYSSAQIMGVPIETVIKHFRQHELGKDQFSTLSEYALRFRTFLETDQKVFPQSARVESSIEVVQAKFRSLRQILASEFRNKPDRRAVRRCRGDLISRFHDALQNEPNIPSATDAFRDTISQILGQREDSFYNALYHNWIPLTESEKGQVRDLMVWFLLKEDAIADADLPDLGGGETGVVIAGFGADEFFPRIEAMEFVFSCDGTSKYNNSMSAAVHENCSCVVIPFAQVDMVKTFMDGRTPSFDVAIGEATATFFGNKVDAIRANSHLSRAQKRKAVSDIEALFREFADTYHNFVTKWTEEQQWGPTIQTIASLPKEELATIAEALINLTVHKRRASPRAETVGPPVDVAVISKGDGLVWIKRKHYFDPTLNPHFMENYFRENL